MAHVAWQFSVRCVSRRTDSRRAAADTVCLSRSRGNTLNTFTRITSLSALALLSTAARAEVVCNNCEFQHVYRGTYIGAFWPGDRATFGDRNIVADLKSQGYGGNSWSFQSLWVFDLNTTAGGTFSLSTKAITALAPSNTFDIEIYEDGGSTCDATRCSTVNFSFDNMKLIMSGFVSAWSTTFYPLTAGRYVIRISGVTRPTGEAAYTGRLIIR
jgi:hypothetical protein